MVEEGSLGVISAPDRYTPARRVMSASPPKADELHIVPSSLLCADCVAKVSEQMLWNRNLK